MARIQKCKKHPDRTATVTCDSCGVPICDDCIVDVGGNKYCKDCAKKALLEMKGGKAKPEEEVEEEVEEEPEEEAEVVEKPAAAKKGEQPVFWGLVIIGLLQLLGGILSVLGGGFAMLAGLANNESSAFVGGIVILGMGLVTTLFGIGFLLKWKWTISIYILLGVLSLIAMFLMVLARPVALVGVLIPAIITIVIIRYLSSVQKKL